MKVILPFLVLTFIVISAIAIYRSLPGSEVELIEIHKGEINSFIIGQSKNEVLATNLQQSFSPDKKERCSRNWISARGITVSQKECLNKSDEWGISNIEKGLCPKNTDRHGTLYFKENTLSIIKIRCTKAK